MNALDTKKPPEFGTTRRQTRRLTKLWAAGTGIALLAVASAYFLANAIGGPLVVTGAGEITLGNVTGFTILGGTIGAALSYVVGRFARRPRLTFLTVAVTALAGYAVVPFTAAESTRTALWLNAFHLIVALPVIGILIRHLPRNRTAVEA